MISFASSTINDTLFNPFTVNRQVNSYSLKFVFRSEETLVRLLFLLFFFFFSLFIPISRNLVIATPPLFTLNETNPLGALNSS